MMYVVYSMIQTAKIAMGLAHHRVGAHIVHDSNCNAKLLAPLPKMQDSEGEPHQLEQHKDQSSKFNQMIMDFLKREKFDRKDEGNVKRYACLQRAPAIADHKNYVNGDSILKRYSDTQNLAKLCAKLTDELNTERTRNEVLLESYVNKPSTFLDRFIKLQHQAQPATEVNRN
ncbi:uncharacterized protein DMAD_01976 [Drosophila madeirensis]|uniref:Uncharacterized protein n=1 Tax=Drosophila madeirensis TaxID=30013 RepID=A0AAU9G214_DROMD